MVLFFRHRNHRPEPKQKWAQLPSVTVQLPVYNEPFVIARLLDAVGRLDYPREQLQIQILDDSTDETTRLIEKGVERLKGEGLDVSLLHRNERREFKAGALAESLPQAKGEFLAIFDADFVPPADFLKRTIHYFTDSSIGMLQTQWGHLNRDDSFLTRAQALWLDAHFRIEQVVRSRAGYCFNFNGTAGIWRKSAILSSGGWQGDTLTEDLDLSYRAQLAGWKGIYLEDVVVPGELPDQMNSLKSQQHRWTKGSLQTAIKLLPTILRSRFSWHRKLEACFHLCNWLHFLLAVLLVLFTFPSILIHQSLLYQNDSAFLYRIVALEGSLGGFLIFSTLSFYSLSQWNRLAWRRVLIEIPLMVAISMGLSLNNSRAILEVARGHRSGFVRTPKGRAPFLPRQGLWRSEILIGLYMMTVIFYAFSQQLYLIIPFLIPAGIGFLYTGIGSVRKIGV